MAIDVQYRTRVNRPVETVFAVATDIRRMPEWAAAREIRGLIAGPVGKGTRFQVVADFLGVEYALDYRVEVYEPCRKFSYRSSGFGANEVSLDFEATEGGTLLTYTMSFKVNPLLGPAVKGGIKKAAYDSLVGLVMLLEEGE